VIYFEADTAAKEQWKSERKQRIKPTATSTPESQPESVSDPVAHVSGPEPMESPDRLDALHKRLSGYYEIYHYATARARRAISISLLHVNGINRRQGVINCEIHDHNSRRPYFHSLGRITALGGFLYWEFLPDQLDGMIYCCSYAPVGAKYPGCMLYGIFLTCAGGNTREYPVAARAVLRYLGETPEEAMENSIIEFGTVDRGAEELLLKRVGGYLPELKKGEAVRVTILEEVQAKIVPHIGNNVSPRAVPFVLKMPRMS
jgi:hypothetical protein